MTDFVEATRWRPRLPAYLKQTIPPIRLSGTVRQKINSGRLHTVCEEAVCPNRTSCWADGSMAFQILGNICTRRCAFCAEKTGRPSPPDVHEPRRLAETVKKLGLRHVVVTSPSRDDLSDQGAGHFAACVTEIRQLNGTATVEILIPDFQGWADLLDVIFQSRPDVLNHNVETVRRLTPLVRSRATYDVSLRVLRSASEKGLFVKSGLMVGFGETMDEINQALNDLRSVGVRCVTIGQYLPPSPKHYSVRKFYALSEFDLIRSQAEGLFESVSVGPLVRSSYHAGGLVPAKTEI